VTNREKLYGEVFKNSDAGLGFHIGIESNERGLLESARQRKGRVISDPAYALRGFEMGR